MDEEYINEYIFSGSLPENASTYVTREADEELYEALKQGKFCYVLNSRQSGKSSLRVRTMSRLSEAGVECASIDLSSVSIQSATQENWYADLIVKLIDSFDLDVDFQQWWEKNQLNSSLLRFGNFLEKKLLVEIRENIVIFIDEIDSVLSLKFPTDDFFAFIRSCYNQRVDNPEFNRLTFCLLGVASPSNLIEDKQRTPFNIGKAISLKGFQLHEVEPLQIGLEGKFSKPQAVMREILEWTGGQPFLHHLNFRCHDRKNRRSQVERIIKIDDILLTPANATMNPLTLDLRPVIRLTHEQFEQIALANPDLRIELSADGELSIMPPTGGNTGRRNADLTTDLNLWNRQTRLGVVFDSSTIFRLPNGAERSPDAAWIILERWNALTQNEQDSFPPLCPDFVIELRSKTDSLKPLQAKMQEYQDNGCRLGWLMNYQDRQVEIYRPQREKEVLQSPQTLSGEEVLPGFVLDLQMIWE
ncbi:TPR repeat-containing protein [Scytonema sp. HK-05]|nr:TPR repeat-containing protein [Scytonema sp. HK-05]